MKLTRRDALAAHAASTAVGLSPATVLAQAAEKPKLTLGVGGKPSRRRRASSRTRGSMSRSTISAAGPSPCRRWWAAPSTS